MTAAPAFFMLPTALVFPALMRKANTPPSSATLSRARRPTAKNEHHPGVCVINEQVMHDHEQILHAQHEDFRGALSAGKATRVTCS